MDDKKKQITPAEIEIKTNLFQRTVKLLFERVYGGVPPSKVPISVIEAALVGIAKNIDQLENEQSATAKAKYETLLRNDEFSEAKLSEGLSGKLRVVGRIEAAIQVFR